MAQYIIDGSQERAERDAARARVAELEAQLAQAQHDLADAGATIVNLSATIADLHALAQAAPTFVTVPADLGVTVALAPLPKCPRRP